MDHLKQQLQERKDKSKQGNIVLTIYLLAITAAEKLENHTSSVSTWKQNFSQKYKDIYSTAFNPTEKELTIDTFKNTYTENDM